MRLYEIVERQPFADSPCLGEAEIVRLDGEKAFLFASRLRGGTLANREWEWDDGSLAWNAVDRFGEGRVDDLLANTNDPAHKTYRDTWRRQKETENGQEKRLSHRQEMRAITVGDILSSTESNDSSFGPFRGWGRFDARLVDLCKHGDAKIRRRAVIALEQIEHPLVRDFALSERQGGVNDKSVVGPFSKNFQRGDEERILEYVEFPVDEDGLHWLLMGVIKVLENNPDADCSRLGLIVYASTPYENCRHHSARLLHRRHVAPGWLLEECRFDSSERNRNLDAEITRPSLADSE